MPTPPNGEVEEFDVDDNDQDVESTDVDDENQDDSDTNDDQDDADTDEDTADDTDDEPDEGEGQSEDGKFEKRYTQLKGDTLVEYKDSLEDAYNKSSAEGVRLNTELSDLKSKVGHILAAAEANPDLAKQLGLDESGTSTAPANTVKSPAETYAEQMMQERMEKEYSEFTTEHPEVDTDDTLRKELLAEVSVQSAAYNARSGKIISMADALNRAWKVLGYDDNSKEKLAVKAKENASQGTAQGTSAKKKSTTKPEVSEKAMALAKQMGLSEKDVQKYYK